ncbi:hypothetical protein WIN67_17615 [Pseudomonas idahonensis]|uniref:hypothetical protein n=1 Tax=Pseudomonas idahonensis TaxID=2942628 RepID=UPI0030D211EA
MAELDSASDDSDAILVKNEGANEKRALSRIERILSDDEMSHSGVQKMILDRLDVAEDKVVVLERVRDEFYDVKRELAVAKATIERVASLDTMQSTMLGVGCLILGYIPTAWGNVSLTILACVTGLGLVGGSYSSKRKKV